MREGSDVLLGLGGCHGGHAGFDAVGVSTGVCIPGRSMTRSGEAQDNQDSRLQKQLGDPGQRRARLAGG